MSLCSFWLFVIIIFSSWNFGYENWCYRKLRITVNMCWVIGLNPVIRKKVCVVSHFKPLGLRCEMIVIPLD